jgi:DNA-binding CsgD family transcriptional regulator
MPRQRISLRIELALDRWRTGDTAEAFAEARVALDEARSVKDDRLIGTASALVSLAAMQAGRLAEAERHALLAEGVFTALADQEIAVQPDGLVYSVWASGFLGNYQRVTRLAERGLNLPRVNGRAYLFGSLVVVLTDCLLRLGHVEDAERHAEAGLESALLVRMGPHLAWALTVHACVALERDAVKTAISDGERAASLLSVGGPPNANAPFLIPIVLGEAYLAAGVPDRARHHLLAPPALDHLPPRCVAVRLRLLTETEVVTGHLDRARGWAVEAESVAAQQESAETRAHALWARGLCDLAEQAPKDAMDAGRQAATLFDGLGLTLDAAKVRLAVVARSLLAQREHDRAIEVLTGVHVIALRLGATRLARLAIRVPNLSGASALGLPRRPDGLPKLTSRERDVVALIVRGCTNREIADALHLSLRTVETYVSRVLEKWGVRTRAAIAALANVQDPSELSI